MASREAEEDLRMTTRHGGLVAAALLAALAPAGCKKEGAARKAGDAGPIVLTTADGAPLVGQAWTVGVGPGGGTDPTLRACRVALGQPGWGPGGQLAPIQLKLRTVRSHGTRAEVLRFAQLKVCADDGISEAQCTPDRFLAQWEWCDGDPRPETKTSPEVQALADRIRSGAPVPAGAEAGTDADAGTGDAAGPADAAMPPYAPDGAQLIY
jgi:hypothetical protein